MNPQTSPEQQNVDLPPIPPHILELASGAISTVLEQSSRPTFKISKLVQVAYDTARAPATEFSDFTNAVNADPRVAHIAGGRYARVDDAPPPDRSHQERTRRKNRVKDTEPGLSAASLDKVLSEIANDPHVIKAMRAYNRGSRGQRSRGSSGAASRGPLQGAGHSSKKLGGRSHGNHNKWT